MMIKHIIRYGEPGSVLTHGVGALLAIVALCFLLTAAFMYGTTWHIVTFAIFGVSLVLLYSASALYHAVPHFFAIKQTMLKLDKAMIFFLIAGTWTPVCLTVLRGPWGWTLFGVVWTLAIAGIILKVATKTLPSWFTTGFYLGLGWLALIALIPLQHVLPPTALAWLVSGGILYTIGAVFCALEKLVGRHRWFGMHEIFHLFVIAGSFSHVWFTGVHLVAA